MELPKRKNTRLPEYDYNTPGTYFITICTKDRKCLLAKIVGDVALDVPQNRLTEMGRIVQKYIHSGENINGLTVDKYVIMPNHIHIMVIITERHIGRSLHDVMRWFETMVTNEYIRYVKIDVLKPFKKRLFQKSFHDHIIRNETDYQKI